MYPQRRRGPRLRYRLPGGNGGRRWVKSAKQMEDGEGDADVELQDVLSSESPGVASGGGSLEAGGEKKLDWLSHETSDLSTERTIWRVNRTISRCSTVKEALAVVEEMKAAGLNPANEGTYVALITVCRRQKQGERALIVYEAMKQAGVQPGLLTFNALISCCQQAQRLEDALRLKSDMESRGLVPDVVTYTSLMALVVRTGPYRGRTSPPQRFARAMELHKEMLLRGVPPDAITYNTLLYAGAQAKLPGKVLEVYGMMVAAGVTPNQFTFGILLEAVGHGGRLKAALQVFNEMKAAGIAPSTSTFNFLIEACGTAPQPDADKAWALFEEMDALPGVRVNAETLNNLITACCKAEDHDRALRAFDLMKSRGFSRAIRVSTYNKLIHCAAASGRPEKAFQLYSQMTQEGHKPDVITFGTLISACSHDGDVARASATWQEMEGLGIKPNRAVYHALMGVHGHVGEWQRSVEVFRQLQQRGQQDPMEAATGVSYNIVLDALMGPEGADAAVKQIVEKGQRLGASGSLEAALELYREGMDSGVLRTPPPSGAAVGAGAGEDLIRCDLRNMTRAVAILATIDWVVQIKRKGAADALPQQDFLLVTGSISKNQTVGEPRGRFPKLFTCVDRTLQALGLKGKALRTLTMQALKVEGKQLVDWTWET